MIKPLDAVPAQFVERFGILFEGEGLPRTAGRMMAFLLMQDAPCDFDDLRQALRISHGTVSTNTRLLETLGVIEKVTFPGDRKTYVRLVADPYDALLTGALDRARKIRQTLADTRSDLPPSMEGSIRRLETMEAFYGVLLESITVALSSWESRSA